LHRKNAFSERNLIAFSIALDRGLGTGNNLDNHKIGPDSFSLRKPVAACEPASQKEME
jgi:hypothetical protein